MSAIRRGVASAACRPPWSAFVERMTSRYRLGPAVGLAVRDERRRAGRPRRRAPSDRTRRRHRAPHARVPPVPGHDRLDATADRAGPVHRSTTTHSTPRSLANRRGLMILCHPHNPTGHVFTRSELERIAEIAARHDLVVVSDEIHADLVHAPHGHVPFESLGPDVAARTITVTSASKAFNLAGLRWAIMHAGSEAMRSALDALPAHYFGAPNVMAVEATATAWTAGDEWLEVGARGPRREPSRPVRPPRRAPPGRPVHAAGRDVSRLARLPRARTRRRPRRRRSASGASSSAPVRSSASRARGSCVSTSRPARRSSPRRSPRWPAVRETLKPHRSVCFRRPWPRFEADSSGGWLVRVLSRRRGEGADEDTVAGRALVVVGRFPGDRQGGEEERRDAGPQHHVFALVERADRDERSFFVAQPGLVEDPVGEAGQAGGVELDPPARVGLGQRGRTSGGRQRLGWFECHRERLSCVVVVGQHRRPGDDDHDRGRRAQEHGRRSDPPAAVLVDRDHGGDRR